MINLDQTKIYQKYDTGQVAKSIELLADQVRQVLSEARLIKIPREYSKINQVVVNGMGGSNVGAGIVKAALSSRIKAPLILTPGYEVPHYVGKNTLYVISSYSGNTEEPLSVYGEVKSRGAKILAITCDSKKNKLADLMLKENIPGYIFKPEYNPSGQPRLGQGYMIFGATVLLAKAGLFELKIEEMEDIIASMEIWDRELRPLVKVKHNKAKQLAIKLYDKQIVAIAAEFLIGNLRILRNQFSETGKNFASYLTLPELNHYSMEGLSFPKSNQKNLAFLFFDSELYHPRITKRARLTKVVARKNNITVVSHKLIGQNKLKQAFEMFQLGSWVSFYLGMLNQVNPAKITWVDWFKKKLGD